MSMPTAHTSEDAPVHTPSNIDPSAGESATLQAFPFQCSTVPSSPVAQTSFGPVPWTLLRSSVTPPLSTTAQVCPSKWRIAPDAPTAHASRALAPHTARRSSVIGTRLPDTGGSAGRSETVVTGGPHPTSATTNKLGKETRSFIDLGVS